MELGVFIKQFEPTGLIKVILDPNPVLLAL
jgi:hypothetical protein